MWGEVYEDFSELTKSEQIVFEAMKQNKICFSRNHSFK